MVLKNWTGLGLVAPTANGMMYIALTNVCWDMCLVCNALTNSINYLFVNKKVKITSQWRMKDIFAMIKGVLDGNGRSINHINFTLKFKQVRAFGIYILSFCFENIVKTLTL